MDNDQQQGFIPQETAAPISSQEGFTPLKEKKEGNNTLMYIIIAILILALLGYLVFILGLFGNSKKADLSNLDTQTIPKIEEKVNNLNFAPINSMEIETLESFPVQKVLVLKGDLADSCTYLNDAVQMRDGNIFYITLDTKKEDGLCTQALVPFEKRISLNVNGLPGGAYIVNINGKEINFELEQDNKLDFSAGEGK